MANEIPVEQVGSHSEGVDVDVDVSGSSLENPDEKVTIYNAELDETTVVPRFAFDALWSKRGWVEYDLAKDPAALVDLRAARQDGAPEGADQAPPPEGDSAVPAKGGTPETGAAPAADKK